MLRGFRNSKFYTKSKSDIKNMKLRLETIKKKRNAMQKYLKNDIADLLRTGLDTNAYGRAEGFLVEQNISACYDLVENFVECISSHLSLMQNQRECPEECREAVPSLMYAAARFADLPELRDLRNMFTERYGNSLEPFLNKEFVERLRRKTPTKEMKVQLMHAIAKEFSIEWDSKALEQKLYTPPAIDQGHRKCASLSDNDDDDDDNMFKPHKWKDAAFLKRKNQDAASVRSEDDYKSHASKDAFYASEDATKTADMSPDFPKNSSSSVGSRSEDEADNRTPFDYRFIPPPYYKPKPGKKETDHVEKVKDQPTDVAKDDPKPKSVRRKNLKTPPGRENPGSNDGDSRDEEERIMDGLLMHYCEKQSPYESSQMKGNVKPCLNQGDGDDDTGESTRDRSRRSNWPQARAASLPPEPTTATEETNRPGRTRSLQPDAHVHPKLPQYDELAARIAALRGI